MGTALRVIALVVASISLEAEQAPQSSSSLWASVVESLEVSVD
jgi:hypothetical protein